jgi:hypothetical protein
VSAGNSVLGYSLLAYSMLACGLLGYSLPGYSTVQYRQPLHRISAARAGWVCRTAVWRLQGPMHLSRVYAVTAFAIQYSTRFTPCHSVELQFVKDFTCSRAVGKLYGTVLQS